MSVVRLELAEAADLFAEPPYDPLSGRLERLPGVERVLRQLEGAWKVKAENLRPLFEATRSAARRFKKVRYQWHPRAKSVDLLGH